MSTQNRQHTNEVWLIEPFSCGSHKHWADALCQYSSRHFRKFDLEGGQWKMRLKLGALSLAERAAQENQPPSMFLATDMLDLPSFIGALPREWRSLPSAIFFHENQFAYPWSPQDREARRSEHDHYALMNLKSAISADRCFFNSKWNQESFLAGADEYLKGSGETFAGNFLNALCKKCVVLPVGVDLSCFSGANETEKRGVPLVIWNHRWEYDKNPKAFFCMLSELAQEGVPFQLAVLGEPPAVLPPIFARAQKELVDHIVHWGYASRDEYVKLLNRGSLLPVTANQEFFGVSVVEAISAGCLPILPGRLSYPEIIDSRFHSHILYGNYSELKARVREALLEHRTASQELRDSMQKFDWSTVIRRYDDELGKVIRGE